VQSNSPSRYDNEGYSALDIPTSAAVAYLRERAATTAARNTARDQALTEARRLLLVTDATCDLPSAWLRDHNVAVIPVDIRQNDQTTRDFRDEVQCSEFALQLSTSNNRDVLSSEPLQPVQIRDHVQAWMNNDIDNVMQVTFAASRSKHYLSSLAATQSLVLIHNKVRRSMGNRAPLRAWVLDSQTGLTGEALLLAHAVYLRDRGTEAAAIAEAVKQLRGNVHTLLVPGDLRYLYQALQLKGDRDLPRWKLLLGRWLDIRPLLYAGRNDVHSVARVRGAPAAIALALARVTRHVELGLSTPTVCVSYAGDLEALFTQPAFTTLRDECRRRRVELISTTMSMTGCVKLGPAALSISFASERFLPA
jgi:fatty acid-binding protein DegV